MSTTTTSALDILAQNPGHTAAELGISNPDMMELEANGRVVRVGIRKTGKRGRPPIEWAVAGQVGDYEVQVPQFVEHARQRVSEFKAWLSRDAHAHQLHARGEITYEQMKDRAGSVPEIPSDRDYQIAAGVTDDEDDQEA